METNIILAGVGGQGIVSISYVIDMVATRQGLSFKQAEVHGMSQRGGAVISHLRISDTILYSDLVPKGQGSLVLAIEPLESLRYVDYLGPKGTVVSAIEPFVNIADYPDLEQVLDAIATLGSHTLIASERLARQAGSARAQNMVLLGAASPYLGLKEDLLEPAILEAWAAKGEKVQKTNIQAFRFGRAAGQAYRSCLVAGIASRHARMLIGRLTGGSLTGDALPLWKDVFGGPSHPAVLELLASQSLGKIAGSPEVPRSILAAGTLSSEELASLLFKLPS